jgi:hypothetical protein
MPVVSTREGYPPKLLWAKPNGPPLSAVIGHSFTRLFHTRFNPAHLLSPIIATVPGGKVAHMFAVVDELPTSVKHVTIVCGSNELGDREKTPEHVMYSLLNLAAYIRHHSALENPSVTIAYVPERVVSGQPQGRNFYSFLEIYNRKRDQLNRMLWNSRSDLYDTLNICFANQKYRISSYLGLDGYHPNRFGIDHICTGIKMKIMSSLMRSFWESPAIGSQYYLTDPVDFLPTPQTVGPVRPLGVNKETQTLPQVFPPTQQSLIGSTQATPNAPALSSKPTSTKTTPRAQQAPQGITEPSLRQLSTVPTPENIVQGPRSSSTPLLRTPPAAPNPSQNPSASPLSSQPRTNNTPLLRTPRASPLRSQQQRSIHLDHTPTVDVSNSFSTLVNLEDEHFSDANDDTNSTLPAQSSTQSTRPPQTQHPYHTRSRNTQ